MQHRRTDQGITQYRSHRFDVKCQVGPGADQAERGRKGDSALGNAMASASVSPPPAESPAMTVVFGSSPSLSNWE